MDAAARPPVLLHSGAGHFALRQGPWKLQLDAKQQPAQLFHLWRDAQEETNLLASESERAARMAAELAPIRAAGR
jgi:hypothetical protein